jgi:cytochrome c oxidase accessory protein FixG
MKLLNYFEKRERTYPQDVKGKFRNIKNISSVIYLIIFFLSPFIRWDRGFDLSDQAILIDIVNSRGYFFFIKIWPEEVYYFTGLLVFAATALFFITSLFGRIWCGYSCPQTVWTDLFVKVERFFQGDRNKRIILDRRKSFNKFFRKLATHIVWLIISLITGWGFVIYFNDAFDVTKAIIDLNLSINITGWIFGVAGMTYVMAGFAREQVCNYMCPYARFQSVMFDDETLIVSYDEKRGESRAKYKQGQSMDDRGHCIDCKQCVVVCPQNIDIRNGLQMECIACGLCVDACDQVMKKLALPTGLIRYDTSKQMSEPNNKSLGFRILKPRTFYYGFILSLIAGLLIYTITSKLNLDLKIIPTRNPLFVMMSNGDIRNGYEIKVYNKSNYNKSYKLEISGLDDIKIKIQRPTRLDLNNIDVKNDSIKDIKLYLSTHKTTLSADDKGKDKIEFILTDIVGGELISKNSVFISKK